MAITVFKDARFRGRSYCALSSRPNLCGAAPVRAEARRARAGDAGQGEGPRESERELERRRRPLQHVARERQARPGRAGPQAPERRRVQGPLQGVRQGRVREGAARGARAGGGRGRPLVPRAAARARGRARRVPRRGLQGEPQGPVAGHRGRRRRQDGQALLVEIQGPRRRREGEAGGLSLSTGTTLN